MVDKDGLIYVLHEEERLTRANDDLKLPPSSAPTCMTAWTLLTSEWDDDDYTNFSRPRSTSIPLLPVRHRKL